MATAAAVDTPGYFVGAPLHYQKPQPLPPLVPAPAVDELRTHKSHVTTLGLCKEGENLLQNTTTLLTLRFNRANNPADTTMVWMLHQQKWKYELNLVHPCSELSRALGI